MSGARTPVAPAAESLHDKLFGILTGNEGDSALDKAMRLNELAQWIESARYVTSAVRREASIRMELEATLRKAGIAFNSAVWEDGTSEGLLYLHMTIREEIEAARKAMQDALAASQETGR